MEIDEFLRVPMAPNYALFPANSDSVTNCKNRGVSIGDT